MMDFLRRLARIERRVIFIFVAVAVIVPVLLPRAFKFPPKSTAVVKSVYDEIEKLGPNSKVVVSLDFDFSSDAELKPMTLAILDHLFRRKIKVIGLTIFSPTCAWIGQELFDIMRDKYNLKNGEDYVFLGFKPGTAAVIFGMGSDILQTFPKDNSGVNTTNMEIFSNLKSMKDVDLLLALAAGATIDYWMAYGSSQYGYPMAAGCTAVMYAQYFPFVDSGQLKGLIGGLKGAAEYEVLVNTPETLTNWESGKEAYDKLMASKDGRANRGMSAQSLVHLVIILFLLIGNLGYFAERFAR